MSDASIALNRFGLGARAGDPPPADPKRWLRAQFDSFDPRPAPIAAAASTAQAAAALAKYQAELKQLGPGKRKAARRAKAMADQPGTMAAAAPATAVAATTGADPRMAARRAGRKAQQAVYNDAVAARTGAAIASDTPFVERLVHFWANHFAVSADMLTVVGFAGPMEFEAIRPHVLGKFGDMVGAVERHPAMLFYLDQAQSIGPDSPIGQRISARGKRKVGLNENLGREAMELHTLGVRTGYDQADVTEFARALTGWTVAGIGQRARVIGTDGVPGSFAFAEPLHEPGARTIMGTSYTQNGVHQAQAVFDDLVANPATARHISAKLARHFVSDDPPPALVDRMQAAFVTSGGDLPSVYRVMIDSAEAWAPAPSKFKSPWEWSISAMRALNAAQPQPRVLVGLMKQLGQPIWKPGSPAGYDDIAATWAGPDALMRRVDAAQRFANQAAETIDARALAATLFPGSVSAATEQALTRAESPKQALALLLVSPEFLRR